MSQKREALETAFEYIQRLYQGIEEATRFFRINQNDEGFKIVTEIVDGLGWLVDVVDLTQDIQSTKIDMNDIKPTLLEMITAMEDVDGVYIADLLEYEIKEKLEKWYEQIEETLNNTAIGK